MSEGGCRTLVCGIWQTRKRVAYLGFQMRGSSYQFAVEIGMRLQNWKTDKYKVSGGNETTYRTPHSPERKHASGTNDTPPRCIGWWKQHSGGAPTQTNRQHTHTHTHHQTGVSFQQDTRTEMGVVSFEWCLFSRETAIILASRIIRRYKHSTTNAASSSRTQTTVQDWNDPRQHHDISIDRRRSYLWMKTATISLSSSSSSSVSTITVELDALRNFVLCLSCHLKRFSSHQR